jgi:hypothetical protein
MRGLYQRFARTMVRKMAEHRMRRTQGASPNEGLHTIKRLGQDCASLYRRCHRGTVNSALHSKEL